MNQKLKEAWEKHPFQFIGAIPFFTIIPIFWIWAAIVLPFVTIIMTGIIFAIASVFFVAYFFIETDIFG